MRAWRFNITNGWIVWFLRVHWWCAPREPNVTTVQVSRLLPRPCDQQCHVVRHKDVLTFDYTFIRKCHKSQVSTLVLISEPHHLCDGSRIWIFCGESLHIIIAFQRFGRGALSRERLAKITMMGSDSDTLLNISSAYAPPSRNHSQKRISNIFEKCTKLYFLKDFISFS